MNEILDCKRMMFGKLWKELWSFYVGHWWLFRITKTWSENRQQVENFQFLVSKLSIARQNAVSQRNNILTDRNFIWFCGKNQGDTISLIKCSTVPCHRSTRIMITLGCLRSFQLVLGGFFTGSYVFGSIRRGLANRTLFD